MCKYDEYGLMLAIIFYSTSSAISIWREGQNIRNLKDHEVCFSLEAPIIIPLKVTSIVLNCKEQSYSQPYGIEIAQRKPKWEAKLIIVINELCYLMLKLHYEAQAHVDIFTINNGYHYEDVVFELISFLLLWHMGLGLKSALFKWNYFRRKLRFDIVCVCAGCHNSHWITMHGFNVWWQSDDGPSSIEAIDCQANFCRWGSEKSSSQPVIQLPSHPVTQSPSHPVAPSCIGNMTTKGLKW